MQPYRTKRSDGYANAGTEIKGSYRHFAQRCLASPEGKACEVASASRPEQGTQVETGKNGCYPPARSAHAALGW